MIVRVKREGGGTRGALHSCLSFADKIAYYCLQWATFDDNLPFNKACCSLCDCSASTHSYREPQSPMPARWEETCHTKFVTSDHTAREFLPTTTLPRPKWTVSSLYNHVCMWRRPTTSQIFGQRLQVPNNHRCAYLLDKK